LGVDDDEDELSFESLLDDDSEPDDSEPDDSEFDGSFFFASFPLPFRAPEAARESFL
jgi:hypothetical protein